MNASKLNLQTLCLFLYSGNVDKTRSFSMTEDGVLSTSGTLRARAIPVALRISCKVISSGRHRIKARGLPFERYARHCCPRVAVRGNDCFSKSFKE